MPDVAKKYDRIAWLKIAVFLLLSLPFLALIWQAAMDQLGADPIEHLLHELGEWGLRLLLLTLAMTPLRLVSGWRWPIRFRRMLGLFSFFYLCLHFLVYLVLDRSLYVDEIIEDIIERPYIMFGMAGLLLMLLLALTSTNSMMKRLGRRWSSLHKTVYVIAVLSIFHYLLLVKADLVEPLIYAAVLLVLLLFRTDFLRSRLIK